MWTNLWKHFRRANRWWKRKVKSFSWTCLCVMRVTTLTEFKISSFPSPICSPSGHRFLQITNPWPQSWARHKPTFRVCPWVREEFPLPRFPSPVVASVGLLAVTPLMLPAAFLPVEGVAERSARPWGLSGMLPRDNNQEGLRPAPEFLLVGDCPGSCVYPRTERHLPSAPLCHNDNTTSFIFPKLHPRILRILMAKTELCGAGPSVCALD